jgi:23S rRNA-/tRNA-specific pseudouridylate synthase
VNFTLETGKKNQIRVHSSDAGFPVAGDIKYGAASNPANRLMLHAFNLAFFHPVKRQKMEFTVPPPGSFDKIILNEEISSE